VKDLGRTERSVPDAESSRPLIYPSDHIAFGQMLAFEAHLGLRKYAYFIQASKHSLWQGEPPTRKESCLSGMCHLLKRTVERGSDSPTARRIISLAQPAQQMYFRGSSIEIARLSPLRSWPASAQDGHCVR